MCTGIHSFSYLSQINKKTRLYENITITRRRASLVDCDLKQFYQLVTDVRSKSLSMWYSSMGDVCFITQSCFKYNSSRIDYIAYLLNNFIAYKIDVILFVLI